MTLPELTILLTAAFAAGLLNAIAGGGSFLTLPALAFTGVPLVSANATGTAALLPGYLSGTWAFRRELRAPRGLGMAGLVGWALAGGAAGAMLLTVTSNEAFRKVVPWLLLAATALFAFGPALLALRARAAPGDAPVNPAAAWRARLCIFAVAVYGGYFNGGLGILLLAMFALLGEANLNTMNGAKNFVSTILTLIAVVLYAASGVVVWKLALIMMVASTAGGYAGGRLARVLPVKVVRAVVIATGLTMAAIFFYRS